MNKYIEVLGSTVSAAASPVPSAAAVVAPQSGLAAYKPKVPPVGEIAASVVGAFIGWKVWKKHHWLGLLTGLTAGAAGYEATVGHDKKRAAVLASSAVVAVAGSKAWKRHPVLGWIGGSIAGTTASDFIVKKVAK